LKRSTGVLLFAATSAITALTIAGCPGTGSSSAGQGTLRLLITDKPFPFEFIQEARVTITKVEVRAAEDESAADESADEGAVDEGGTDDAADADAGDPNDGSARNAAGDGAGDEDDDAGSPFIVVYEGEKSFDLLQLRNGKTDLLADATLPAGRYTQMRIHVTEGLVVLNDGREFPLRVPSGEQTGIKLHFEFEVADGEQAQLLLDVDLSRAFSAIPSGHIDDVSTIREFKFHPSLAMRLIDLLDAGSISGMVSDAAGAPLAAVAVTAFNGTEEVSTTSSAADGTYSLGGLPTGTYRLEFSLGGYSDAQVENVEVQAGAATENVNATLSPPAGA
jgi:hypothetical protein